MLLENKSASAIGKKKIAQKTSQKAEPSYRTLARKVVVVIVPHNIVVYCFVHLLQKK